MARISWQLIGTLLIVGLLLHYWWAVLLLVLAVVAWNHRGAIRRAVVAPFQAAEDRRIAAQRRVNAIRRRADQQHAWTLAGDPRGTYGNSQKAAR